MNSIAQQGVCEVIHLHCGKAFALACVVAAVLANFPLSISAAERGAATALADQKAKPAANDNPFSLLDGKLVFDVQERLRLEERSNNFDFNERENAVTDELFLLSRFRLGLTIQPDTWVKIYVQGQDSREIDSERLKVPFVLGAEGDDPFDLRQAYVALGDPKEFPLLAKVGRQELTCGDERLVGAFDWNNFARTFDAGTLRYVDPNGKFWAEAFGGHVVTIRARGPDQNEGFTVNDANWNDTLAGLYLSSVCLPVQTTDVYLFYRSKENNDPVYNDGEGHTAIAYDIAQEVWTLGVRIKSTPGKLSGWDYELEGAYQFGRSAGQQGMAYPGPDLIDHNAFAAHVGGGYTWEKCDWRPRLGLEYNVASGDENPNDDSDESFLNLFPTNHKFYGYMDFFAWKNVHNPALSFKVTPVKNVTVQLDGHSFWLFTNEDAWYRANAVTRVRALNATARDAGAYVGSEVDLTVTYAPFKWLKLQAGYSHFWAGDYVKDTASGLNGKDGADFGYLQTTFSF
ncbi:MAG: hypothetical protein FJ388_04855 [Verrucomicrobia bacterium]|nr:hypothetical protein [Verrucomicrobiota bacterium]